MQKSDLAQSETINFAKHPELVSSFKTILGEIETVIDVLQREELDFELLVKTNQGLLKDLRLAISKYPEAEEYYQQHLDELGDLETLDGFFENPEYVEENRGDFINHFKQIHQCIENPLSSTLQENQKPLYYFTTHVLRGHQSRVESVNFSPHEDILASASYDGTVRIWNIFGEELQILNGHTESVNCVVFSPDGGLIASGSSDNTVRIWNLSGEELQVLRGHNKSVHDISFSPDGKTIASTSFDNTIRLWNLDGEELKVFRGHENYVRSLDFSPDGKTIASASSDETIRLWNISSEIFQILSGHTNWVNSVCFSDDGRIIVSASSDRTVRLWDNLGNELKVLHGHTDRILSACLSPNTSIIASASRDGTVILWDKSGIEVQILRHNSPVRSVSFSPDGNTIASASDDGTVRLWEKSDQQITYIPQGISNDLAQGDDQLSIEDELQAIADVLLLRQLEPPIAVGILGTWGSGKSFGMHLIQERANEIRCADRRAVEAWGKGLDDDDPDREKKLSPYVGHIYQIKFNAWSYAKSNLWASLMGEIFAELDKQITFERQLQKAGVDLLRGGKIWEALEKLNEGDRQYFLEQNLDQETFERLRKIELKSELQNELLETLRRSQNQAHKDIQAQEKLLEQTKQALKQRQCEIAESMDNNLNLALASSPELIKQVHKHFGESVELKITETIRTKDPDFDPQNVKDLIEVFGDSANLFLGDRKPEVLSIPSLRRWLPRVWKPLLIFLVLVFICILIPWKFYPWFDKLLAAKADSETWSFITSAIGLLGFGTPASFKARDLLSHFSDWSKEAKLTLHETQKKLQQEMRVAVEQDPKAQKLNAQLTTLKKDIEHKRHKLPELQYDSLAEFLGDRLKPENYSNYLGMINQVQIDLQDLSDKLLPPKEKRDEKIKELFPRGEPRVILYIDDLDRCPPKRVVEVLETVQLLLKTQLFVVVLAVDDRYIARALEEVYSGVLKRRGKPSGIDYLEKIIQIPYRMRPISADTVDKYLSSQIQVIPNTTEQITSTKSPAPTQPETALPPSSEAIPQAQQQDKASSLGQPIDPAIEGEETKQQSTFQQTTLEPITTEQKIADTSTNSETLSNINEINTIEQSELDLIVDCCQYVDITPRTGKRLINIYKILKIVWQQRQEPNNITKKVLFSFLALSGRYPDFMRNVFEEIDTEFQEELEATDKLFDREIVLAKVYRQVPKSDYHAQREWRKFKSDIRRMLNPNPFRLDKADFYLALSFCFVGDIGYDPDDFSQDPITPVQQ